MEMKKPAGLVVDIERFSTQNGPGIRTTAFLKGCPLQCAWCSNPETQGYIPEIMLTASKCTGCGQCVSTCPNEAIGLVNHMVSVNFHRCLNCLKCTDVCKEGAIRKVGKWYSSRELYDAVSRDKEFYGSRGGVTFTGGEPLSQWKFLLPVLKKLKEDDIGVCIDTTGYISWSILEKVKDYVTIFLYDIKHLDSQNHKNGTGVENERILENLTKLAASGGRIWLRAPMIPGYNDSNSEIRKLAELAHKLDVERLCLLPFHTLGKEKYIQLGKRYPLEDTKSYTADEMIRVQEIAEKYFSRVYVS